jgi:hypothetical protein
MAQTLFPSQLSGAPYLAYFSRDMGHPLVRDQGTRLVSVIKDSAQAYREVAVAFDKAQGRPSPWSTRL